MAETQPFRGVLYNTSRVRPADVLTQPYDKITPEMREHYLKRSPHNLIRIELGEERAGDAETNNKYTRARHLYQTWLGNGVLRRSARPALYYLEQTFTPPTDSQPGIPVSPPRTRKAIIARVRLHRWDEGIVLPHEHTLSKPKADRLALLRACGSQQGQIFMLYPSSQPSISSLLEGTARRAVRPTVECVDDAGVTNTLWEVTDPAAIATAQERLRDQKFYIADGHHRYETALAFRDECRAVAAHAADPEAPYEFVMATLVDMSDPGLVILPTHRAVSGLKDFDRGSFERQLSQQFVIEPQESLSSLVATTRSGQFHIGMYDGKGFAVLRPKDGDALRLLFANKPALWHTLDVAVLHVAILEALLGIDEVRLREESNVSYWRELEKALDQVKRGAAQLAFFLNPTHVEEVKAIADAGSRMPQKSTDFYPKLLSGLVMYDVQSVKTARGESR